MQDKPTTEPNLLMSQLAECTIKWSLRVFIPGMAGLFASSWFFVPLLPLFLALITWVSILVFIEMIMPYQWKKLYPSAHKTLSLALKVVYMISLIGFPIIAPLLLFGGAVTLAFVEQFLNISAFSFNSGYNKNEGPYILYITTMVLGIFYLGVIGMFWVIFYCRDNPLP